jgi:DNA-binding transcriptional MerR regulator
LANLGENSDEIEEQQMRIGQVSTVTNVSVQTIRLYERLGLLTPSGRSTKGYRTYETDAVQRVRFIRQAQQLGFTLREIAQLVSTPLSAVDFCQNLHTQASRNLQRIDQRIEALNAMRLRLATYLDRCHGRTSAERCPLYLAQETSDINVSAQFRKLGGPLIELVFIPDCPSIEWARVAIREALTSQGMQLQWLEWERNHPSTPPRLRSLGSPSVVVNRVEVACVDIARPRTANSRRPYADQSCCTCKAPSTELIQAALANSQHS